MSFIDFKSSALATLIAEFNTLPICTIKTIYQTENFKSPVHAIKHVWSNYGILGFYRASIPAITGQILSTSSKYYFYQLLESNTNNNNSNHTIKTFSLKISNGIISGLMSSLLTHPLDVVKTFYQRNEKLSTHINSSGFKVFYRGYSKSITKVIVGSSLFFPLYDFFQFNFHHPVFSSFITAIIATTLIHPIDYLKVRHMSGLTLYYDSNLKLYFKGLSLNLFRIVPHFMLVMSFTDYFKSKFNNF